MMRLVVLVALAAIVAVNAQKPRCTPDQYMGGLGYTIGQVNTDGKAEGFTLNQYGAWDFRNRKLGLDMSLDYPDGRRYAFRLIQDYTTGVQWVISERYLFCEKQEVPSPEPSNCLPPNVTYAFSGFLGGKQGVYYDTFFMKATKGEYGNIEGDVTVSAVKESYIPLSSTFIGTYYDGETPYEQVNSGGWYNVEEGIPDPKRWFDLPSFCQEATGMTRRPEHVPDFSRLPAPRVF